MTFFQECLFNQHSCWLLNLLRHVFAQRRLLFLFDLLRHLGDSLLFFAIFCEEVLFFTFTVLQKVLQILINGKWLCRLLFDRLAWLLLLCHDHSLGHGILRYDSMLCHLLRCCCLKHRSPLVIIGITLLAEKGIWGFSFRSQELLVSWFDNQRAVIVGVIQHKRILRREICHLCKIN